MHILKVSGSSAIQALVAQLVLEMPQVLGPPTERSWTIAVQSLSAECSFAGRSRSAHRRVSCARESCVHLDGGMRKHVMGPWQ